MCRDKYDYGSRVLEVALQRQGLSARSGRLLECASRAAHADYNRNRERSLPVPAFFQTFRTHPRRFRRYRRVSGSPATRAGSTLALQAWGFRFVLEEVPGAGAFPFSEHSHGALTNAATIQPPVRSPAPVITAPRQMGGFTRRYASRKSDGGISFVACVRLSFRDPSSGSSLSPFHCASVACAAGGGCQVPRSRATVRPPGYVESPGREGDPRLSTTLRSPGRDV